MDRGAARGDPQLTTSTQRRLPSSAAAFWIAFAVLGLLASIWSLASPVFSVPDENAHATKAIAQLQGQVVGRTVDGVKHLVVDLAPEDAYTPNILCFATHPAVPASCDGAELGDPEGSLWFNTWVGAYNPVYYYLVGWPSLFLDGNATVYGMRIASALVGSAFLAFAFVLAMAGRRSRWLPFGVAFVAGPMNLYLLGAVNPNGLELAASVALWVGVLRLFQHFDPRASMQADPWAVSRTATWAIVTASAIALASARALGPLWLVVVVALAALVAGWAPVRRLFTAPSSYAWLAAIAAAAIFSLGWTLFGGSLSSQAEVGDAPLVGAGPLTGAAYMLRMTPDYLQQAAGWFGWLDTPLPAWTYWLIAASVGILVVLAATALRRRSTVVFWTVLAAGLLVPVLVQVRSVSQTGIIWQGRYGLFLYLGILVVAAWLLSGRDGWRVSYLSARITRIGAVSIAAFGLFAFWFVLLRYVVGLDQVPNAMWNDPQWQPPLGWMTLLGLYAIGSVAYVALIWWLAGVAARRDPDPVAVGAVDGPEAVATVDESEAVAVATVDEPAVTDARA